MKKESVVRAIDAISRRLSLMGLLGISGLAGVFDERYYALGSLSFLSYLAYFRFFNTFLGAPVSIPKAKLPLYVASMLAPIILIVPISRGIYIPQLGFVGFMGFLSLALDAADD